MIVASAAELRGRYVGSTEQRLRQLFTLAEKHAPCVLCIDEIDAIGHKRLSDPQHGSDVSANSAVDQLLTLLATVKSGVIVIATTNHSKVLDPAVVRAGRFDRHIEVPMPDKADRLDILKNISKIKN